jgi:hypothetical protein
MTRTASLILGFAAFCLTASFAHAHVSTAAPEDGSIYSHRFTDDGVVNTGHKFTDDGVVNTGHKFTDDGVVNTGHKFTDAAVI